MNQNLVPQSERTKDEQREIARKGGIASGKARLRKKTGRELMQALLEMKEEDPEIRSKLETLGIEVKDMTKEVAINVRQIEKAARKADTGAFRAVHELAGHYDKKADAQGAVVNVNITQLAADAGKKWSTQEDEK